MLHVVGWLPAAAAARNAASRSSVQRKNARRPNELLRNDADSDRFVFQLLRRRRVAEKRHAAHARPATPGSGTAESSTISSSSGTLRFTLVVLNCAPVALVEAPGRNVCAFIGVVSESVTEIAGLLMITCVSRVKPPTSCQSIR